MCIYKGTMMNSSRYHPDYYNSRPSTEYVPSFEIHFVVTHFNSITGWIRHTFIVLTSPGGSYWGERLQTKWFTLPVKA